MIPNENYEILISFLIYLIVKILCNFVEGRRASMHTRHPTLTSIPERNEAEDDVSKWIPKKKHELLKAKYKTLKKLFQIYDASVIGILPQNRDSDRNDRATHRKSRSRRTNTDASAGISLACDVSDTGKAAAAAVLKDLKLDESTPSLTHKSVTKDDKSTQDSMEDVSIDSGKDCDLQSPQLVPYLLINEKRKPTRFQCFIQRILGIRRERDYAYVMSRDPAYAASENNITNRYEKRRRRGLRFRRQRRAKKTHSEMTLRDIKCPVNLSYVESIQKNCLLDKTPRRCPILGCGMLSYGIINYNDHLNLCHFTDRTYICVYCHEGFTKEYDKSVHENEHIGISKLNANLMATPSTTRFTNKIPINTQTDPEMSTIDLSDAKLRKIVSFFDKISDPDQMIAEIKRNRSSESNLLILHRNQKTDTESEHSKFVGGSENSDSDKTSNSTNLQKIGGKITSTIDSDVTSKHRDVPPLRCQMCGEHFDYRRQLNVHVDIEHRTKDKFSKFHSCAGIINHGRPREGRLNIQSTTQSLTRTLASADLSDISRRKSDESLSYEPSTNIVNSSLESVTRKPPFVNTLANKVRRGFCYKWEPGTKVIHV